MHFLALRGTNMGTLCYPFELFRKERHVDLPRTGEWLVLAESSVYTKAPQTPSTIKSEQQAPQNQALQSLSHHAPRGEPARYRPT